MKKSTKTSSLSQPDDDQIPTPKTSESTKIIDKILKDPQVINVIRTIDTGIEFEVRFGLNDGSSRFIPNVGVDTYQKIIKNLEKKYPTNKFVNELSIVMYNNNSSTGIRMVRLLDDNWKTDSSFYMKKTPVAKCDNSDYGLRFSSAQEIILDPTFQPGPEDQTKNYFRARTRKSMFFDKKWRLDITKVASLESITISDVAQWKQKLQNNEMQDSDYTYEIELEYIGTGKNYESIVAEFKIHLSTIFDIIYDSNDALNKQLRINIFNHIRELMTRKNMHFQTKPADKVSIKDLSNQVITLEFKNIKKIQTEEYTVTEKSDGERMLMYCNGGNNANLITSGNELLKLNLDKNKNISTFLLDGELVTTKKGDYVYYVFDILIFRGKDITQMQFPTRQKMTDDIVNNMTILPKLTFGNKEAKFSIVKKIFYDVTQSSFFAKNKHVLDTVRDFEIDGLIYTPLKGSYFEPIYKWKMKHTIDFLIRKTDPNDPKDDAYDLYVNMSRSDFKQNEFEFPDDYFDVFPFVKETDNNFPFLFVPEPAKDMDDNQKWYQTEISKKKFTELGLEDDTIVEFEWNYDDEMWKPQRIRKDRTVIYRDSINNPGNKYYGNAYFVAITIYKAINYPITEAMIIGKDEIPKSYWSSGNKENIKGMLNFHSHLKIKYIYNKYCKGISTLLELGGGKSNDFKKWIGADIGSVTVIDIDPTAIEEGSERTKGIKKPSVSYIVADVAQDLSPILKKNKVDTKYDSIVANFAVHYFCKNKEAIEQLVANIDAILQPGGHFVFTTFNGDKVFTDLAKTNPILLKNSADSIVFSIQAKYVDKKFKHYGQSIEVFVESIGVPHEEPLMNLSYVIKKFIDVGFTLIENSQFVDILDNYEKKSDLSPAEMRFSGFNNLVVLRK